MAELYVKQGHVERAIGIYRRLVGEHPSDLQAKERLAELEALVASTRGEAMSFREHTQGIVESTPGAVACSVMGFDGIAVDSFLSESAPAEIGTLLTEYSAAVYQLRRSPDPSIGRAQELTIRSIGFSAVLRLLTDEYFMAVVIGPGGMLGKASYLARVTAPKLIAELT